MRQNGWFLLTGPTQRSSFQSLLRMTMNSTTKATLAFIVLLVISLVQDNKLLTATVENRPNVSWKTSSVNEAINATYEALFFAQPTFNNLTSSMSDVFNATYEAFVSTTQGLWSAAATTTTTTDDVDKSDHNASSHRTIASPLVDENGLDMDTSVIITSSLIPTHPSIAMINETIHSLTFLQGLSPRAPVYVTVDGLPPEKATEFHRLDAYVRNLRFAFGNRTNFHILPSDVHRHIAGSIKMAVDVITTKYIYVLQHDFPFIRPVDHANLRKSMEEYPQYIRNVRFEYKPYIRGPVCDQWKQALNISTSTPVDFVNGLQITLLRKWSDNNHFTTLAYYQELLDSIVMLKRPPEFPMMVAANKNCSYYGQSVYGEFLKRGAYLRHLDGQRTQHVRVRRY